MPTGTVAIAGAVLLAACGQSGSVPTDGNGLGALTGRTFVKVAGAQSPDGDLVPGTTLTISFTAEALTASAGCNTMGAPMSLRGDSLILDQGLSITEMGCDPARMSQDEWVADLLTSRPRLDLDGTTLTLSSPSTVIALTDVEIAEPDQPLTGTRWTLDAVTEGDVVSSIPQGASSSLRFAPDGGLIAILGCNRATGSYTVDGDDITFGPLVQTTITCARDATPAESVVSHVLQGTAGLAIDGRILRLTKDTRTLTYRTS